MRVVYSLFLALTTCAHVVNEQDRLQAQTRYDLGVTSLTQGDTRTALQELLAAVALDPYLPQAHHGLGLLYQSLDRKTEALTHYDKAVELKPNFSDAHNNLGTLLLDLARYDEAIEHFNQAVSDILYATPSLAFGNMGWAYYKKGDYTTGLKHLQNAVAINPQFCRGYDWLLQMALSQNDSTLAETYTKRFEKYCLNNTKIANTLKPVYVQEMRYKMAQGLLNRGDKKSAQLNLEACIRLKTESVSQNQCEQALASLVQPGQ